MLAVVDPGVGTARRAIAIEVAGGAGVLVGPDNGLLAPAVAIIGGAERAVELTNADYHLAAPGATFAGRDIFAPVAAHLCNGVDLAELGPLVDADLLMPGMVAAAARGGRRHPRRGAVGRPLRQLPAQRRPRRARPGRRRLGRDDRRRAPHRPRRPRTFGELGAGLGRARARLAGDVRAGARPALGRPRAAPRDRRRRRASPPVEDDNPPAGRRRRSPSSCAATGSLARSAPGHDPRHRAAAGGDPARRRDRARCASDYDRRRMGDSETRRAGDRRARQRGADHRWARRQPRRARSAATARSPTTSWPTQSSRLRGGLAAPRRRRRRPRRRHLRQRPPVRDRLPGRRRPRCRRRAAQPGEPGAGAAAASWPPSTPVAVVVDRTAAGAWRRVDRGRAGFDRARHHGRRRRHRRGDHLRRAARRRAAARRRRRPRPPRGADVHQRHRRRATGGDADPRQPAGEHRPGPLGARPGERHRRRLRRHPGVPHLRAQRRARAEPLRRGDGAPRPALRPGDRPRVDPRPRRDGDPRHAGDVGGLRPLRRGAGRRLRHGAPRPVRRGEAAGRRVRAAARTLRPRRSPRATA